MREHPPQRRRAVRDPGQVLLEPVVEVEPAGVAELHDRDRGERLRDRADRGTAVSGRRPRARASQSASPTAPDQTISPSRTTAAATDGSRSAWRAASARSSSGASSLGAGTGVRAPPARARSRASMSASSISRCVTARRTPGLDRAAQPDAGVARAARSPRPSVSPSAPTSTWTKFVSTLLEVDRDAARRPSPRRARARARGRRRGARRCARARRGPRRRRSPPGASRRRSGASRPARAPSARASRRSRAPSGQPSPFERQSVTVSKSRPISAAGTPSATDAFAIRAPSRWTARPSSRAARRRRRQLVERPDRAARAVVGVLEREHRGARRCSRSSGRIAAAHLLGRDAARASPGGRASAGPSASRRRRARRP